MRRQTLRTRGLVAAAGLLLGYLAGSALLLWGTAGALDAVRSPGPASPDSSVALAAAAGAWALLTWLTVVTLLTVLTAALAGLGSAAHHRAAALAPAASRRLVGALLGLTIAGAPLAAGPPAGATEPAPPVTATSAGLLTRESGTADRPSPDRPAAATPDGWTPDRPAATHRRSATSAAAVGLVATKARTEHVADEVVVRRGDTLWDIAARHLGPDASAAEVATEWPRWHRANRDVIGTEPDLLLPGERLVPPPGR